MVRQLSGNYLKQPFHFWPVLTFTTPPGQRNNPAIIEMDEIIPSLRHHRAGLHWIGADAKQALAMVHRNVTKKSNEIAHFLKT